MAKWISVKFVKLLFWTNVVLLRLKLVLVVKTSFQGYKTGGKTMPPVFIGIVISSICPRSFVSHYLG